MKNTPWRTLTGGTLLLFSGLFLITLYTKSTPQLRTISTSVELPRAERMAAQKAYFQQLYQDPKTNQIPLGNALHKSLLIKKIQDQARLKTTQVDLDWEEAGPNNVGGRTRAIALDRRDSKIVLTGGVRGGIWKSTNDGATWRHTTAWF